MRKYILFIFTFTLTMNSADANTMRQSREWTRDERAAIGFLGYKPDPRSVDLIVLDGSRTKATCYAAFLLPPQYYDNGTAAAMSKQWAADPAFLADMKGYAARKKAELEAAMAPPAPTPSPVREMLAVAAPAGRASTPVRLASGAAADAATVADVSPASDSAGDSPDRSDRSSDGSPLSVGSAAAETPDTATPSPAAAPRPSLKLLHASPLTPSPAGGAGRATEEGIAPADLEAAKLAQESSAAATAADLSRRVLLESSGTHTPTRFAGGAGGGGAAAAAAAAAASTPPRSSRYAAAAASAGPSFVAQKVKELVYTKAMADNRTVSPAQATAVGEAAKGLRKSPMDLWYGVGISDWEDLLAHPAEVLARASIASNHIIYNTHAAPGDLARAQLILTRKEHLLRSMFSKFGADPKAAIASMNQHLLQDVIGASMFAWGWSPEEIARRVSEVSWDQLLGNPRGTFEPEGLASRNRSPKDTKDAAGGAGGAYAHTAGGASPPKGDWDKKDERPWDAGACLRVTRILDLLVTRIGAEHHDPVPAEILQDVIDVVALASTQTGFEIETTFKSHTLADILANPARIFNSIIDTPTKTSGITPLERDQGDALERLRGVMGWLRSHGGGSLSLPLLNAIETAVLGAQGRNWSGDLEVRFRTLDMGTFSASYRSILAETRVATAATHEPEGGGGAGGIDKTRGIMGSPFAKAVATASLGARPDEANAKGTESPGDAVTKGAKNISEVEEKIVTGYLPATAATAGHIAAGLVGGSADREAALHLVAFATGGSNVLGAAATAAIAIGLPTASAPPALPGPGSHEYVVLPNPGDGLDGDSTPRGSVVTGGGLDTGDPTDDPLPAPTGASGRATPPLDATSRPGE